MLVKEVNGWHHKRQHVVFLNTCLVLSICLNLWIPCIFLYLYLSICLLGLLTQWRLPPIFGVSCAMIIKNSIKLYFPLFIAAMRLLQTSNTCRLSMYHVQVETKCVYGAFLYSHIIACSNVINTYLNHFCRASSGNILQHPYGFSFVLIGL